MGENFKISVEKACPACSIECPNFEIDSECYYGESFYEGRIAHRDFFCRNADLCGKLWSHLSNYKNGLEGR